MDKKDKLLPFHQWLTSLDYFTDLNDRNFDAADLLEIDQPLHRLSSEIIQSVPLKFSSEEHYQHVWLKLFYDEVKAQIIRSKIQQSKQPQFVEILQVDDLNNHFKLISFKRIGSSGGSLSVGALVVLSPVKPNKNERYPCLLGLVESSDNLKVKAPLNEKIKDSRPQDWQIMIKTKNWYLQEICAISTLEREYFALHSLTLITPHLKELIFHPNQHNKEIQKKFKIPQQLNIKLKSTYNQSQYQAINQCLKQMGITLIQGPPGTGKTKTVLGTLSILLNSFKKIEEDEEVPLLLSWKKSKQVIKQSNLLNPWLSSSYKDWRDQPLLDDVDDFLGLTQYYVRCDVTDNEIVLNKKNEGVEVPGKVLVCGPSNASVDEIIRKLINENLLDGHGQTYIPSFVRVGQNFDPCLKEYSLDYLAQKLLQKERGTDLTEYRSRILTECRLVFGTLSSIGSNTVKNSNVKFDTVVIDEAGQSIEISNLIPLGYNCQRLILIGDPNQLPATVFSSKSLEHKYDQSLFERMMKSGFPVSVLKTQYRMQPEISEVIGKNFYGQKLQNWENIVCQEPKLVPNSFIIFHVDDSCEITYKKSYKNSIEARAVKEIAQYLSKNYQDIGIVSPYSQQIAQIQSFSGKKNWEIKTIDSFQGRQKEVIIFSAVRARKTLRHKKVEENKRKTIGFVGDVRRINVSLSRAKRLCVIVGDVKRLSINPTWRSIVSDAIEKQQVYSYSHKNNYLNSFSKHHKDSLMKQL